jgi:hypothetical protein
LIQQVFGDKQNIPAVNNNINPFADNPIAIIKINKDTRRLDPAIPQVSRKQKTKSNQVYFTNYSGSKKQKLL